MRISLFIFFFLYILIVPTFSWADKPQLPYYDEIMKIINSIEYSAFETITKPEVDLRVDFNKKTWTLLNIHQYDAQGGIVLEQGRYGLCAELSTYTYQKLQTFLPKQYDIKFAAATESGFFPTYESNHIVLVMHDQSAQNTYLIDPSFHRYGDIRDFYEYKVFGFQDALKFIKDQSHYISFFTDQAMPLFIKEGLLVSFSVTSVDGRFDKNNFLLVVSASRHNTEDMVNIIVIGRYDGQMESFEGKEAVEELLGQQRIDNLYKKLTLWLQKI